MARQLCYEHECIINAKTQDEEGNVVIQRIVLHAKEGAQAHPTYIRETNASEAAEGHCHHAMNRVPLAQIEKEVDDDDCVGSANSSNISPNRLAKLVREGPSEQAGIFKITAWLRAIRVFLGRMLLHNAQNANCVSFPLHDDWIRDCPVSVDLDLLLVLLMLHDPEKRLRTYDVAGAIFLDTAKDVLNLKGLVNSQSGNHGLDGCIIPLSNPVLNPCFICDQCGVVIKDCQNVLHSAYWAPFCTLPPSAVSSIEGPDTPISVCVVSNSFAVLDKLGTINLNGEDLIVHAEQ
mmetsp:Transcript_67753/g.130838  ORF Transcript_67753/g.130838 Transcript_67753/m.130838 type:complete len:291 (+) Transcript_67753:1266-2138(+)